MVSRFGPIINPGTILLVIASYVMCITFLQLVLPVALGGSVISLTYVASEKVIPGYGGGMSSAKAALESDTRTLGKDFVMTSIEFATCSFYHNQCCSLRGGSKVRGPRQHNLRRTTGLESCEGNRRCGQAEDLHRLRHRLLQGERSHGTGLVRTSSWRPLIDRRVLSHLLYT